MRNERRHGKRTRHHGQVTSTPHERLTRATAGRSDQVPAMHNERLREQRRKTIAAASNGMGTTIKFLGHQNEGAGSNWAKARIHESWARIQMNPPVV
jgi:LmbE family N-acetylglucosaminyl deacetylase